ncbi:MAG TPA: MG2 domain-containing protein [Candidatus Binatia bacterium]|jgi:uncharacterized protein YfaS (alpha-2-macroglobulin family)|nr:MG2 domain-containing protein [Candidatus Binatia bacterium]
MLVAILWTAIAAAAPALEFTPQGTVKDVRQAQARFPEAMVPLGDPRLTAPFTLDCPEKGSGRWVDPRTWVFDFTRDVPAGVQCTFRLTPGLKSRAGTPIPGPTEFAFATGGPAIEQTTPSEDDSSIEEDQAFVLVLDAPVDDASVVGHATFSVEDVAEAMPARVLTGAERDAIVATLPKWRKDGPLVVLAAPQTFPNGKRVTLTWGAGIRSTSGVATDEPHEINWKVRDQFTAELRCDRENPKRGCIPLTAIRVRFSAPVAAKVAQRVTLVAPDGRTLTPVELDADEEWVTGVDFKPPFPEAGTFRLEMPPDLRDETDRALVNAGSFPLTFTTAAYPPLAKFASRFGIIESKADPALPVTVRDLEAGAGGRSLRVKGSVVRVPPDAPGQIIPWLRRLAVSPRESSVFAGQRGVTPDAFKLPRPNGDTSFEVIGIPLAQPGLYIIELSSKRLGESLLGKSAPVYVPTAALVTNMAVHLKWGREGSLAWVTALETGKPVPNAKVSVLDCNGRVLQSGVADGDGILRLPGLPAEADLATCSEEKYEFPDEFFDYSQVKALSGLGSGLLVVAQTDDDLSFVHSSWDEGIEPFRFDLPSESWDGPTVAHTVLDRALFRAGETVHMKHLLRTGTLDGFSPTPAAAQPTLLSIRHLGSDEKFEQPVTFDARGNGESTFELPRTAKLGSYDVVLVTPPAPGKPSYSGTERTAASFRVEEFRVPLMRGTVQLPAAPLVAPRKVGAEIGVRYLSGGVAATLPVRVRGELRPYSIETPPSLRAGDYSFANGPVRVGIQHRGNDDEDEGEDDDAPADETETRPLPRQELVLDATGTLRARIPLLPVARTPQQLLTELEFRDPNGEAQTVAATVPIYPGRWLPGIAAERWVMSKGDLQMDVAVVDVDGKLVPNAPVRVDAFDRRVYSSRKRVVGGFYAYDNVVEVTSVGMLCEGRTNAEGKLACTGRPKVDGNVILQATVTDPEGHTVVANRDVWVSREGGDLWFEAEDHDRIDLLPEKPRYEPGETARFQVRMPFREATALVTIEREGVRDARVVSLSGTDPVVEVPIDGAFAPNVFVSVLVVRGRVGDVQPTMMVDLGRPSFKVGIAGIDVGWRTHTLAVTVTTDRPVYAVRETATVDVQVATSDGTPPTEAEIAVAAVDEGLLQLAPNPTWKVLDEMMAKRGYGVRMATAQMQVVGKRHYGLKAIPQGGGGGRQPTRELFDTLLLWKGRVPLDAEGKARVSVPLNDSLTSFRIVAVATAGLGQFGTGATSIRSTQDLMVLSGLPPVVREGDQFRADFTVRNTTERSLPVTLGATVTGLPAPLAPQTFTLAPGEAKLTGWDVTAPVGVERLEYVVDVSAEGGAADKLKIVQQVRPAIPVRVLQATLFQWAPDAAPLPVARPADALPDRGGLTVGVGPTLLTGLDGVRTWFAQYPYTCLEQQVSRAVGLGDLAAWKRVTGALPSYQDGDGLLKYFPPMETGSETLTAYVLSLSQEAGLTLPDDVRDKALDGLAQFVTGKLQRTSRMADLPVRKLAALDALSRFDRAEPDMLASLVIEPNLWPTSAALDWWSVLQRVPAIPERGRRIAEIEQIVRARLNLAGTTMRFSSDGDDLWWLMTGPETNAVRLVLVALQAGGTWREDLPRVMRGALGMQKRGAWSGTTTNAWGTMAVQKFAREFERTPVMGVTTATLADASKQVIWAKEPKGTTLDFPWPPAEASLAVTHAGMGRPWITLQSHAAIPLKEPLSAGYRITKTITAVEPQPAAGWRRDELMRVRLEIDAQSDMSWVVVDDPIPAGASHAGTGLGNDSSLATAGEQADERLDPTFAERSFTGYRAYYEYVPKGTFVVEYTIRLNQAGTFQLPPTRVEALYAPELFGEIPNPPLVVQE